MLLQQGDVLLESVNVSVGGHHRIVPTKRGLVLAEGEVTGHAHCISDTQHAELVIVDGKTVLNVTDEPVVIHHEEHGAVEVPPGVYTVRKVREYDHMAEEAREVQD